MGETVHKVYYDKADKIVSVNLKALNPLVYNARMKQMVCRFFRMSGTAGNSVGVLK